MRQLLLILLATRSLNSQGVCQLSESGVTLVKHYEQFRARPYTDGGRGSRLAIGYGYTHGVKPWERWTEETADAVLRHDLQVRANKLCKELGPHSLTRHQLSALVSLSYNMGVPGVIKSTLFQNLKRGQLTPDLFRWYVNAKGKPSKGLKRRREAEIRLWHTPPNKPMKKEHL